MSKAITVQDFQNLWGKMVQQINAMNKVPFPKTDEVAPMSSLDSVPRWSNNLRISAGMPMGSDYALGNPTLDMMAEIETVSPLAQEIPLGIETFMPMEVSLPIPKVRTLLKPAVALPHNKVPELPMLKQVSVQEEQSKEGLEEKNLQNLLAAFKESGVGVKEVKLLPSGATRITFDEFFGAKQDRQQEFVRIGRNR